MLSGNGHTQATSLFQCQPSSEENGKVFTPSIPDFYFRHGNAADYSSGSGINNLTRTGRMRNTYIFTIPAELAAAAAEFNCNGTIVSIQYCYDARNQGSRMNVFDLVTLNKSGNTFTVASSFRVQTTPQSGICTLILSGRWACCDRFDIPPDNHIQLLSSSNLTYGVVNRNNDVRPLTFVNAAVDYRVEQFSARPSNNNLNLGRSFTGTQQNSRSLLLLRFIIGWLLYT